MRLVVIRTPAMRIVLLLSALVVCSCVRRVDPLTPGEVKSVTAAADRSDADKALDATRNPEAFLAFTQVGTGGKVAELMAGGGYTTELLSRAVGPTGTVYGENPKLVLEKFAAAPWAERVAKLPNVKRLDRELDDPFPSELEGQLDVVVSNAIYHDTVNFGVDRAKMNNAVYWALKSNGIYVVCDSSAKRGAGVKETNTLHRIEETVVRDELSKAGFSLEAEGNFLRHADDQRDWNTSPAAAGERRGQGDRFCLRFIKRH